jgi:hypothetical protein
MLKFHHIGHIVPLAQIKSNPQTKYAAIYEMYSLDEHNSLTLPIELHAFGPHSSLDRRIQTHDHVAFVTDDIRRDMRGCDVVMPLYQPFAGYECAMIIVNGQLIELIQTTLTEREIWGDGIFKDSILYPDGK